MTQAKVQKNFLEIIDQLSVQKNRQIFRTLLSPAKKLSQQIWSFDGSILKSNSPSNKKTKKSLSKNEFSKDFSKIF